MKNILLIFFSLLFLHLIRANTEADSLFVDFIEEHKIEKKYQIGERLLWVYIFSDLDKALLFSDSVLVLGQKLGGKNDWEARYMYAEIYRRQGKEEEAVKKFYALLKEAVENDWLNAEARVCHSLGFLYEGLKDWKKSIQYLKKGAKLYAPTRKKLQVMLLSELSDVYLLSGDTIKGRNVNLELLEIVKNEFDPKVLVHILEWSKELDESYSKKCLYSDKELDQIFGYAQRTNNIRSVLHFSLSKMECLLEHKKYKGLVAFGINHQSEFENYEDFQIKLSFYKMMEEAYVNLGNWQKAHEIACINNGLNLQLFNVEKESSIDRHELQYQQLENEKLEEEKKHEQKKKQQAWVLNIILVFLGLSSSLLFLFIWKQRETKQILEKKKLEHQIWRLQFNPHFFFNALTSIQAFIYNNKPNNAVRAISQLSNLFRESLNRSELEWIDLNKEIDFIQEYVEIHKFLSGSTFDFEMNIQKELSNTALLIPPFIIQPMIENAIKHGFQKGSKKGKLELIMEKEGAEAIKTCIRNNGIEFNKDVPIKRSSMGLKITNKKLKTFNAKQKEIKIANQLINNENWVEVSFMLPFRLK